MVEGRVSRHLARIHLSKSPTKVQSRHSEPLETADLRLSERQKQVTARYERIDTVLEGLEQAFGMWQCRRRHDIRRATLC